MDFQYSVNRYPSRAAIFTKQLLHCARVEKGKMAAASETGQRGKTWKESEVRALLDLMKEETIAFNLDNAKTPKEKNDQGTLSSKCNLKIEVRFSSSECCCCRCCYRRGAVHKVRNVCLK